MSFWATLWPRLAISFCALTYGTNFAAVKLLQEQLAPPLAAALRYTVAALAISPWLVCGCWSWSHLPASLSSCGASSSFGGGGGGGPSSSSRNCGPKNHHPSSDGSWDDPPSPDALKQLCASRREIAKAGVEAGIWITLGYGVQSVGLAEGAGAGESGFLCSLTVIVVPLLEHIVLGLSQPPTTWVAAVIASLGVALLTLGGSHDAPVIDDGPLHAALGAAAEGTGGLEYAGSIDEHRMHGLAWSALQPLFFGLGFFRIEHHIRRLPSAALSLTAAQLATTGVAACLWAAAMALATDGTLYPALDTAATALQSRHILVLVVFTGIVSTALPQLLETAAFEQINASEATVLLATEPLFATGFAVAVLDEQVDASFGLGAVCILAACALSTFDKVRRGSHDASDPKKDDNFPSTVAHA